MPPQHQQYIQWNGERFRKWASQIGANTATVVDAILTGYKVEQQGYRACMALLKLSEQYTKDRLEAACAKVLFDFAKDAEKLVIKGGAMPNYPLDAAGVKALASMPSREELLATLVGTLQAPIAKFVRTLNEVPSKFVRTLAAVRDAKETA